MQPNALLVLRTLSPTPLGGQRLQMQANGSQVVSGATDLDY